MLIPYALFFIGFILLVLAASHAMNVFEKGVSKERIKREAILGSILVLAVFLCFNMARVYSPTKQNVRTKIPDVQQIDRNPDFKEYPVRDIREVSRKKEEEVDASLDEARKQFSE